MMAMKQRSRILWSASLAQARWHNRVVGPDDCPPWPGGQPAWLLKACLGSGWLGKGKGRSSAWIECFVFTALRPNRACVLTGSNWADGAASWATCNLQPAQSKAAVQKLEEGCFQPPLSRPRDQRAVSAGWFPGAVWTVVRSLRRDGDLILGSRRRLQGDSLTTYDLGGVAFWSARVRAAVLSPPTLPMS